MSEILHLVQRSHGAPMLFSALPDSVQSELVTHAPTRSFAAGQIIQQRGDDPNGFWLIESGSVSVGQFLPEGEFRAVALLGAGDSWGELALFAGRSRVVDAIARTPSSVRHIAAERFEAALRNHPQAMRDLLGALSRQLQETLEVVAGIRRGSARARVAGMLLTLGAGHAPPIRIAVAQQELGELLGLTRASVNAALREFEQLGFLQRAYRAIELLDTDGLEQTALG